MIAFSSMAHAIQFGQTAGTYQRLRAEHPGIPARIVKQYIDDSPGLSLEQYECEVRRGHQWSYTGSAYGGDDDSHHSEGRVYCLRCGADGDA